MHTLSHIHRTAAAARCAHILLFYACACPTPGFRVDFSVCKTLKRAQKMDKPCAPSVQNTAVPLAGWLAGCVPVRKRAHEISQNKLFTNTRVLDDDTHIGLHA